LIGPTAHNPTISNSAKYRPRRIQPFRQGDLDGLCGLYAIINAARVVCGRKLSDKRSRKLFEYLSQYTIKDRGNLNILTEGLCLCEMIKLMKELRGLLEDIYDLRLQAYRPWKGKAASKPSDEAILLELGGLLSNKHSAAIVGFDHPVMHWTTITGINQTQAAIFDSGYLKNIDRELLSFQKPKRKKSIANDLWVATRQTIFVLKR